MLLGPDLKGSFQKLRCSLALASLTPILPTSSIDLSRVCLRRSKMCLTVTGPSPGTLRSDNLDALFALTGKNSGWLCAHASFGSVVKAILNAAAETGADLIAMATDGLIGLAQVSYGSVAAGVLQAADIPILLIRSCDD